MIRREEVYGALTERWQTAVQVSERIGAGNGPKALGQVRQCLKGLEEDAMAESHCDCCRGVVFWRRV